MFIYNYLNATQSLFRLSQNTVQGKLRITVIDQDNDPIDNGYTSVSLLPVSGEADYIACECRSDTRYLFRFDN